MLEIWNRVDKRKLNRLDGFYVNYGAGELVAICIALLLKKARISLLIVGLILQKTLVYKKHCLGGHLKGLSYLNRPQPPFYFRFMWGADGVKVKSPLVSSSLPIFLAFACERLFFLEFMSNLHACGWFLLQLMRSGCPIFFVADEVLPLLVVLRRGRYSYVCLLKGW